MRLIDADALLSGCKLAQEQISYDRQYANAFYSAGGHVSTEWWCIEDMIEDAPTIEPERKKGKWILVTDNRGQHFECDKCGEWRYHQGQNFCSHCGADMREGEEE